MRLVHEQTWRALCRRESWLQFLRYLLSGGGAAAASVLAYALLVWLGVWYVGASVVSDGVGLVLVFLLNKYVVFEKKDKVVPHAARYVLIQILNSVLQAYIVFALVEYAGMDKVLARVLSIGVSVPWNFFLYKYVVYV